jgi:hypothetical protein
MNLLKLLLIANVIVAASLISMSGTPVPEQGRLEGIVADPSGDGIKGAFILVHWDPAGPSVGPRTNVGIAQDLIAYAAANGRFSIALPPGFYDVLFSASAFSPRAKKLRILPGSILKYDAQLKMEDKFR